jgi:phosphoribosylformylglycinamidine cyclo-ligase
LALTYKKAGVDVGAGDRLVDWLKKGSTQKKSNKKSNIVGGIGGFAGLYRAQFSNLKKPCLVASTDGVGTKVLLASEYGGFSGIGQDLVAMCVNDLLCTGAEPLFFLDYYASGKLDLKVAKQFLSGVKKACEVSGCDLLGGETAEMPGVYKEKHFDCAGFAVGIVDEKKALGSHRVKVGDRLVAVASSGFHSNGYSLLRKIFARDLKKMVKNTFNPTDLYAPLVKKVLYKSIGVKAIANITGGGLDNVTRVLNKNQVAELESWGVPEPFWEVKKRSGMSWPELLTTLNCGLGLVFVVSNNDEKKLIRVIESTGRRAIPLGKISKRKSVNEAQWKLNYKQLKTGSLWKPNRTSL